jgi:hypothetical protein
MGTPLYVTPAFVGINLFTYLSNVSAQVILGDFTANAGEKLRVVLEDASAGMSDVAAFDHAPTVAALAGVGTALLFRTENDAGTLVDVARQGAILTTVAAATVTSALVWQTRNLGGALTERARITGPGAFLVGATAPIGTEIFRVAGGQGLLDFTHTSAFFISNAGLTLVPFNVDTTNGRVGIGFNVTLPLARLDVQDNADGLVAQIRRSGGVRNPGIFIETLDAPAPGLLSTIASGTSVPDWAFRVGVTEAMRIASGSANIGMGVVAPFTRLHLGTDDAVAAGETPILILQHTTSGVPAPGIAAGLHFWNESLAGGPFPIDSALISGSLTNVGAGTEAGALGFFTKAGGGALTLRMFLNALGQLIVGTSGVPIAAEVLRVQGRAIVDFTSPAAFEVFTTGGATGVLRVDTTNGQVNAQGGATTGFHFIGDENTGMTNPSADALAFRANGLEGLRIDGTRQVQATPAIAVPVYSFVGDLDTGIRHVGADDMALFQGGNNRMRMNATGISFFGAATAAQQASAANLTNNVTAGGVDNTIANFTDLVIYANDAATIRNDIYQLARKLKTVNDALRLYGLLT